jgi:molybdenum-dependent DNA-binding transcriptional regulator ModE
MTFEQLEPVVGLRGKIGDDRIRLLEAIDTYGSLSAAARNLGLTYKGVWAGAGITIGQ